MTGIYFLASPTFAFGMLTKIGHQSWLILVALAVAIWPFRIAAAVDIWELTPYRILCVLEIDALPGEQEELLEQISSELRARVRSSRAPRWELQVLPGSTAGHLSSSGSWCSEEELEAPWKPFDKVTFLRIARTTASYLIEARQLDIPTRRWTGRFSVEQPQASRLGDASFELLAKVFAPLARFRLDRSGPSAKVTLSLRGSNLPADHAAATAVLPHDVFLPIIRRNDRDGRPRPAGIQAVPWTYFVVDSTKEEEDRGLVCTIASGLLRPLAARQRARVEQYALAVRPAFAQTVIRLQTDAQAAQPMPGCDIYEREIERKESVWLGSTDRNGEFNVAATGAPVRMLWIKSGHQLMARIPVVAGLERHVDVTLPQDDVRLRVEGQLSGIRDEITDLVARRNILITRARGAIAAGEKDAAREIVRQLAELPTRSQMDQILSRQESMARSDIPAVQARIDRLFAETRGVLAKHLSLSDVSELEKELAAAVDKDS